jgi:predicted metal-dependent hydrolase
VSKHDLIAEYIHSNGISALVVRSNRRKTATVKVEDGEVSIAVPQHLSDERITQVLNDKAHWLKEKLALHQQAQPSTSKAFVSGEAFSYLGRNYRLKISVGIFSGIKLINGRLVISCATGSRFPYIIRNSLRNWYQAMAVKKLNEKAKRYALQIGVKPKSINIKDFKARWGSCSVEGDIDFHWKIMMAPNRVVDYVVVHELCHLLEHNHSSKFWKHVERILPDYAERKEWLKVNNNKISL